MGVVCSQLCSKRECESSDALDTAVKHRQLTLSKDPGFTAGAGSFPEVDQVQPDACMELVYDEAQRAVGHLEEHGCSSRAAAWSVCENAWVKALDTEVGEAAWEAKDVGPISMAESIPNVDQTAKVVAAAKCYSALVGTQVAYPETQAAIEALEGAPNALSCIAGEIPIGRPPFELLPSVGTWRASRPSYTLAALAVEPVVVPELVEDLAFAAGAGTLSVVDQVLPDACMDLTKAKTVYAEAQRSVSLLEETECSSRAAAWSACENVWMKALETEVGEAAWEPTHVGPISMAESIPDVDQTSKVAATVECRSGLVDSHATCAETQAALEALRGSPNALSCVAGEIPMGRPFELLPSVGTWRASRPSYPLAAVAMEAVIVPESLEAKKTPMGKPFELLPSVGTWLASRTSYPLAALAMEPVVVPESVEAIQTPMGTPFDILPSAGTWIASRPSYPLATLALEPGLVRESFEAIRTPMGGPFELLASVGTWLASRPSYPLAALAMEPVVVPESIEAIRTPMGSPFELLPSVGTWLASRPSYPLALEPVVVPESIEAIQTPMGRPFALLPSVGNWLASRPSYHLAALVMQPVVVPESFEDIGFTAGAGSFSVVDQGLPDACVDLAKAGTVYAEAQRAVAHLEETECSSRAAAWSACENAWAKALEVEVREAAWEAKHVGPLSMAESIPDVDQTSKVAAAAECRSALIDTQVTCPETQGAIEALEGVPNTLSRIVGATPMGRPFEDLPSVGTWLASRPSYPLATLAVEPVVVPGVNFRTLSTSDLHVLQSRFAAGSTQSSQNLQVQMTQNTNGSLMEQQQQDLDWSNFRTLSASDWGILHGRFKAASVQSAIRPAEVQNMQVQNMEVQQQDLASRFNLRKFRPSDWGTVREKFKTASILGMWKSKDRTLR